MNKDSKILKEIIFQAGIMFNVGFNSVLNFQEKTDKTDVVTEYDVLIEKFLIEKLSVYYPDFNFIAEETAMNNIELNNTFIIDPIDGTSNFTQKFPYASISVAMYKEGQEYIGVIYNPMTNEYYEGIKGKGSTCNGKKLEVSNKNIEDSFISTRIFDRIGYEYTPQVKENILNIQKQCLDERDINSGALECCFVAAGIFGLYTISGIKPWDIAAGSIIVKEAGGMVCDTEGKDIDILNVKDFLCCSTVIYNQLFNN